MYEVYEPYRIGERLGQEPHWARVAVLDDAVAAEKLAAELHGIVVERNEKNDRHAASPRAAA